MIEDLEDLQCSPYAIPNSIPTTNVKPRRTPLVSNTPRSHLATTPCRVSGSNSSLPVTSTPRTGQKVVTTSSDSDISGLSQIPDSSEPLGSIVKKMTLRGEHWKHNLVYLLSYIIGRNNFQ